MESSRPEESERRINKESIAGGPVTCVSFLSDGAFCWVARGCFLEVAPLIYEGPRKRKTQLVFPEGGTIHGVQHSGNISVVFGGRQLAVLHGGRHVDEPLQAACIAAASRQAPAALNTLTVSDWIWDLKTIACEYAETQNDAFCVALGLANNACEVWMLQRQVSNEVSYSAVRQRRIIGATRSITYSMCFFGWNQTGTGTFSDLVLASGTVSNEILVWTAFGAAEKESLLTSRATGSHLYESVRRPKECCLQGHVGVIHAVSFDKTGRLLASASDDRSVRLWQIAKGDDCVLLWTGWAHKARVWNVAFSSQGVISCGEDAAAKIWCTDDGTLLGEVRVHNCQSLWSIDVRNNFALIGCNDGTAKVWDLDTRVIHTVDEDMIGEAAGDGTTFTTYHVPDDRYQLLENNSTISPVILEDCTEVDERTTSDITTNNRRKKKAKVKVKTQTICGVEFYLDQDSRRKLLVSTRAGSLFSLCLATRRWNTFEPWCVPSVGVNAMDGSCVAVHESGKLVAVGTTRGEIVLVTISPAGSGDDCDCVITKAQRRQCLARSYLSIKRLAWLDDSTLLSFHIKGIVVIWKFRGLPSDFFLGQEEIEPHLVLNTTTMAVPTCFACSSNDSTLFVGDSRGNIAFFLLDRPIDGREVVPSALASRVHKKEYVNDILCLSNDKIISVGNDGCIRHSIIKESGQLESILSVPLSVLPGPSHIYQVKCDDGNENMIVVAGYHSNSFLALDLSSGYELFRVDTGGRQRAHCSFVDLNPSLLRFPASYGMAICVSRVDGLNDIIIQSCLSEARPGEKKDTRLNIEYSIGASLHGEPVFDLCLFTSRPQADYDVLLSGSEDCTARISIVKHSAIAASILLPAESTCIRAVCSSRRLNGNESLLVICGGQMTVQFYGLTDNNTDCLKSSNGGSTILDNMTVRFLGTGYYPFKPSIDPRVNAVRSVPLEGDAEANHAVFTGDSDGSIHLFKVSNKQADASTIPGQLLFTLGRPVLSIEIVEPRSSAQLVVIAGTTDGSVVVWLLPMHDFSLPVSPVGKYKAHQVGTNSISALVTDVGKDRVRLRICSGGDDQSLSTYTVDLLSFHQEIQAATPTLSIVSHARLEVASASAVKGVKLVDANFILSVGYSQRLALWQLSPDATALQILSMTAVDVADVNCFAVSVANNLLAVGGLGVEFFSFSR